MSAYVFFFERKKLHLHLDIQNKNSISEHVLRKNIIHWFSRFRCAVEFNIDGHQEQGKHKKSMCIVQKVSFLGNYGISFAWFYFSEWKCIQLLKRSSHWPWLQYYPSLKRSQNVAMSPIYLIMFAWDSQLKKISEFIGFGISQLIKNRNIGCATRPT